MPPGYIDGKTPVSVTQVDASVSVVTPAVQQTSGAKTVGVPQPTNNDTMAVLTSTQTLSSKTLIGPVISSGNWYLGALTQPVISSGTLTAPIITQGKLTAPTIDIISGTVLNNTPVVTVAAGSQKTIDFSTGNVYIVKLTQTTVLTVSGAGSGKTYQLIVVQNAANSYFRLTYMSGFVNGFVDSGVTQRTGAIDFWSVTFDGQVHYGLGAKDIQ